MKRFCPTDSIDVVRRTILDALADEDVRVLFFGSRARGDARRTSDIDVAVAPCKALRPGVLAGLWERLDDLRVPYAVDLVVLDEVSAAFREQVVAEGIVWRS